MIDAAIFLILFLAFTDNLFQEMTGIFGPVTIGMNSCLLDIVEIVIDKILADFPEFRFQTAITVIDPFQFLPSEFCFLNIPFFHIVFL